MLSSPSMSLLPFIVLGLVNGIVVGLAAGLVARGIAPGSNSLRFRDAAFLGMLGSLVGSVLATAINAQDGYLASGPSSLLFSVVGAGLLIGGVRVAQLNRTEDQGRSFDSRQS